MVVGFIFSSSSHHHYLGVGRLRLPGSSRVCHMGLRAFGQSLLTALTFLTTLDRQTADRSTPVSGYRSVRLDRVPLQDSLWLDCGPVV